MIHSWQHKGFTLIELLAASVISAFIAFVALAAMNTVTSSRGRIDQYTAASDELRYAISILGRDLNNLYRQTDMNQLVFEGRLLESQEEKPPLTDLRFYTVSQTPARLQQPEGDVYEVQYFLTANEENPDEPYKLMRRIQPNPLKQKRQGGMLSMVAQNILRFDALYYDGDKKIWLEQWPRTLKIMPAMIKIKLTSQTADGKRKLTRSAIIDFPRWPQPISQPNANANNAYNENDENNPNRQDSGNRRNRNR